MMVLRHALVFVPSNVRKTYQRRGFPRDCVAEKGMPAELGMCVNAQKGVTGLPEGLCSKEGKIEDGFFWVIRIST